jgi:hypothetical protein
MIAEVSEVLAPARALFSACGYVEEAVLTGYVRQRDRNDEPDTANERLGGPGGAKPHGLNDAFVIPVTVDDLMANGLLGEAEPEVCWERSVETLTARKDDIAGLAVASDERIEAYLLYMPCEAGVELVALRSCLEDGGDRLKHLLARLHGRGIASIQFPKVHQAEISSVLMQSLGFRAAGRSHLYAAHAKNGVFARDRTTPSTSRVQR